MKIPAIIVAAWAAFAVPALAQEPTVFRVSQTGKDKTQLKRIFAAVQESLMREKFADYAPLVMVNRLSDKSFLVRRKAGSYWVKSRGAATSTLRSESGQTIYRADYRESVNVATDEVMPEADLYETGETYAYVTVTGTERVVRVLKQVNPPKRLSEQEFVRRLKGGEEFEVTLARDAICPQCNGTGRVTSNLKKKEPDGKVECEKCWGKRRVSRNYLVKW